MFVLQLQSFSRFSSDAMRSVVRGMQSHSCKFYFCSYQFKFFCSCQSSPFLSPRDFNSLLNDATVSRNTKRCAQIHARIITYGYAYFPFLQNNLINFYSKCDQIDSSLLVFSNVREKNIITWTSIITRLSHGHKPFEALRMFNQMRMSGLKPNHFTLSAILPACTETTSAIHGQQVHALVIKDGFGSDIFVGSALTDMYAKCEDVYAAEKSFDEMPERNLVSWNTLIVGFTQNKLYKSSVKTFIALLRDNSITPDQVSFSSILSACSNMGNIDFGSQVHGLAVKMDSIGLDYVRNALGDMYSKCGRFKDVVKLFSYVKDRDAIGWNVLINGWTQTKCYEEACDCFWTMRSDGVLPDEASFSAVLQASANLGVLDQGALIHNQIIKMGFIRNNCVQSSLVTMYARCGSLADSREVFDETKDRNVVLWTAMISACHQHGCVDQAIELFEQMIKDGLEPDYITFICVLSACSHNGSVDKGFEYLNSMMKVYGISPGCEHYACVVDMLGRAGRLDDAMRFIESIPIKTDALIWGPLLGACRMHGNLEMGEEVAEKLFELEPRDSGNYVLLSNIYARHGMLEEAQKIRRFMSVNSIRKAPGCSWIDFKNKTYVFTVHDKSHPETNKIYEKLHGLAELMKKKGYIAKSECAVNDTEEYKEQSLWYHSERIALAFGLLKFPIGAPIRIKKNIRTCDDCHTIMKLASDIFDREIIVRDTNRFHRFVDGNCSCRDYW